MIEYLAHAKNPIFSICLCCLEDRWEQAQPLLKSLKKQTAYLPIEVICEIDNREATSGVKRHNLSVAAQGKYIAFVDDDDQISENYVDKLLDAASHDPDVITFNWERTDLLSGKRGIQYFSLFGVDGKRSLLGGGIIQMAANHMSAWRHTIARRVAFAPNLGYNDDCLWYKPLIAIGAAKTEIHINENLYFYKYHPQTTVNQNRENCRKTFEWAKSGIECFNQGREIFIALQNRKLLQHELTIPVRDCNNDIHYKRRSDMNRFYIWEAV